MSSPIVVIYLALLIGSIGAVVSGKWDYFAMCVLVMIILAFFVQEEEDES